jgi:hypothetical protein
MKSFWGNFMVFELWVVRSEMSGFWNKKVKIRGVYWWIKNWILGRVGFWVFCKNENMGSGRGD